MGFTRTLGIAVSWGVIWRRKCGYCGAQLESMSPSVSDAAFISPTRSAGGLPAACIYRYLLAALSRR